MVSYGIIMIIEMVSNSTIILCCFEGFMKEKICAFCGHRDVFEADIAEHAEKEITALIENGFTAFYSGGMGEFDKICERVVRRIKKRNDNIKLCLILPYIKSGVSNAPEYYNELYDEIIVPDLGNLHYKRAITERNRWIVSRADMILAYVFRNYGGAYTMLKYAEKLDTEYINVCKTGMVR